MVSYSLGRLCQSLGIDLDNRHRAGGDADYGNLVYSIISLGYYKVDVMIKKTSDQRLPPNLPREDFEQLPEKTRCLL
jgi:DNA polymerase-3 subunit epsilon